VWPLSEQFCEIFAQGIQGISLDKKRVVELGAGAGLCGLFISNFCKFLVMTDGDERLVELQQQNIIRNNTVNAKTHKLVWDNQESLESFHSTFPDPFDSVIAMEVIYNESHVPLVLHTVRKLLVNGGEFILGFVGRRILNASSVLPFIYKQADTLGFTQIPLQYSLNTKSSMVANFKHTTFIAWRVPSLAQVPIIEAVTTQSRGEDDDFIKMFNDPTGLTDNE
jgi:predicted nicotinamide N-methyase